MRELPEPALYDEDSDIFGWTRDQVLAIQKQAYEDGLRDAKLPQVVRYGCHCDLEPDMEPDGCVLDYGKPEDCVYARRPGATKERCEYWKPIMLTASQKEQQ